MNNYYRYNDQYTEYLERRKDIESHFGEASLSRCQPIERVFLGSKKYELEITHYNTGNGCWDYTRGIVRRLSYGERFPVDEIIADVKRNYASFWHSYIDHHPNGNDYLLCGEDYQGQTVVNLTKGETIVHFPEGGYDGVGFCWADAIPSPDFKLLAVVGCYWACPYDLVLFDFSEPEMVPYTEIGWYEGRFYSFKGWKDNETLSCTTLVDNGDDDSTEKDIEVKVKDFVKW